MGGLIHRQGRGKMVSKGNFLDFCEDTVTNIELARNLVNLVNTPGTTAKMILDFFVGERYHEVTIEDCVKILNLKGPGALPIDLPEGDNQY
jgi:hypothetical protein